MTDARESDASPCQELVARCQKLIRRFNAGIINPDELAYNVAIMLVHGASNHPHLKSCWRACFDVMPVEGLRAIEGWIRHELAPLNYRYTSAALLPSVNDPLAVEKSKQTLQPYLRSLHEQLREYLIARDS